MSTEVEVIIPGAGVQWGHPTVLAINDWLKSNVAYGEYRMFWKGPNTLKSDVMTVLFTNKEDATAFTLKWCL